MHAKIRVGHQTKLRDKKQLFFLVSERRKFLKSCKSDWFGERRNFPMLPTHDAIPPAPETAGKLEVESFYSVAKKRLSFPLKKEIFDH